MSLTLVLRDGGLVEAHLFDTRRALSLLDRLRAEGLKVVVLRHGRIVQTGDDRPLVAPMPTTVPPGARRAGALSAAPAALGASLSAALGACLSA